MQIGGPKDGKPNFFTQLSQANGPLASIAVFGGMALAIGDMAILKVVSGWGLAVGPGLIEGLGIIGGPMSDIRATRPYDSQKQSSALQSLSRSMRLREQAG